MKKFLPDHIQIIESPTKYDPTPGFCVLSSVGAECAEATKEEDSMETDPNVVFFHNGKKIQGHRTTRGVEVTLAKKFFT